MGQRGKLSIKNMTTNQAGGQVAIF